MLCEQQKQALRLSSENSDHQTTAGVTIRAGLHVRTAQMTDITAHDFQPSTEDSVSTLGVRRALKTRVWLRNTPGTISRHGLLVSVPLLTVPCPITVY
jgi:hypothetical protein